MQKPFQKWGIDFIGKIIEKYSVENLWILLATYYFTKWIESIPIKRATSKVVTIFLMNNILTIFGVPKNFLLDNATCFREE
jgi:hypothetical protein